ncbi:MAG: class I SAM-dependent methyltransferase [Planctomycetaceae bacterium]
MIVPREVPDASRVGRHYDDLDDPYRDIWGEHLHHGLWRTGRESPEVATTQLMRTVTDAACLKAGDHVVDIGCGYGGTSRFMASEYGVRVTGYTVSEAQWKYATAPERRSDQLEYRLCSWEVNGLADASMDAAIAIECFTHMPSKEKFLAEAYRVLKPGGRLSMAVWMTEVNPTGWRVKHLLEPICREGRLVGMGSAGEYRQMMEAAGFVVRKEEDWSQQVKRTWSLCARRLGWKLGTSPRYWKMLFDRSNGNRIFAVTLARILAAYRNGAMRYGFYVLEKPV